MANKNPPEIKQLSEKQGYDRPEAVLMHNSKTMLMGALLGAAIATIGGIIGIIGLSLLPDVALGATGFALVTGCAIAGFIYGAFKPDSFYNGATACMQPSCTMEAASSSPINTIVQAPQTLYPESETYHREQLMAAARKALLSMDHTKMSPQ